MKYRFPIIFAALLVLGMAACAPVRPAAQVSVPTSEAVSNEPFHPLGTQTGITSIDQILDAISRTDVGNLRSLVEFTDAKCTNREGLGGPPKCRAGEAEGTPLEVLSFLGSEGSFLRRDEIGNWSGIAASNVYAIYEVNAAVISSEQYYPIGKYAIILTNGDEQPAIALRIGESGIVRVDTIFDSSPANLSAMVEREASTVILAPKS